jgi:hypothetical protein
MLSYFRWNQSDLTALCTSDCRSSLVSLQTTLASACSGYSPEFNGGQINTTLMLDFYLYKFDRTCLQDGSSFCHFEERAWDIPSMVASGNATWPTYTNKTYYDWACKLYQQSMYKLIAPDDPINGTNRIDPSTGLTIPPYNVNFTYYNHSGSLGPSGRILLRR